MKEIISSQSYFEKLLLTKRFAKKRNNKITALMNKIDWRLINFVYIGHVRALKKFHTLSIIIKNWNYSGYFEFPCLVVLIVSRLFLWINHNFLIFFKLKKVSELNVQMLARDFLPWWRNESRNFTHIHLYKYDSK